MKVSILIATTLCLLTWTTYAQDGMGIGTTNPDNSAVLEINSPNKGLLIPRMGSNMIQTIDDPAEGLLIFDTNKNIFVYNAGPNGSKNWVELSPYSRGMIMMWSGNPNSVPYGWALCNGGFYDSTGTSVSGTNPNRIQTPDLRGRFVVSYDNRRNSTPTAAGNKVNNYGRVGNTGGRDTHALSTSEMPRHTHSLNIRTDPAGRHTHSPSWSNGLPQQDTGSQEPDRRGGGRAARDGDATNFTLNNAGDHTHLISGNTGNAGTSQTHENRPAYYVLAFIMKL